MKPYTAVVEKCPRTGLYVGYVPGMTGAHTQAATPEELDRNLREVIEMLRESKTAPEAAFAGVREIAIG